MGVRMRPIVTGRHTVRPKTQGLFAALSRRRWRGGCKPIEPVAMQLFAPSTFLPSRSGAGAQELRVGDRVVVVPVAWIPATASLAGRGGVLLTLDRARAIAGVRLEGGPMHAMPANCLRRMSDDVDAA